MYLYYFDPCKDILSSEINIKWQLSTAHHLQSIMHVTSLYKVPVLSRLVDLTRVVTKFFVTVIAVCEYKIDS